MILRFPDLQTLSLAITSGLVPASVSVRPAEFATGDDGRIWVRTEIEKPALDKAALKELGVLPRKSFRGSTGEAQAVSCWPQILPLERTSTAATADVTAKTPVLFVLREPGQLAEVAGEMLRLGNDRQGFRQVEGPEGSWTLLRVVGPPYYTLLRALDQPPMASGGRKPAVVSSVLRSDESTAGLHPPLAAPEAFVEVAARVWVPFGYSHPLAARVQPPPGRMLLIRPPRQWLFLDEGRFQDIYDVLDFTLPTGRVDYAGGELTERLTVPLQFTRGGDDDAAELWILTEKGVEQLDSLVRDSDDRLIDRLAFAVGEVNGDGEANGDHDAPPWRCVVVRARPGKTGPPVLVLDGIACRSYLKLPNLFLPVGRRLHPPLRRDAVKKLLASDPATVTWLVPENGADTANGANVNVNIKNFRPQSLPDAAFRPLSDWVDYVLDSEREPLRVWAESMQFDFEEFVCPDELSERTPRRDRGEREQAGRDRGERPQESRPVKTGGRTGTVKSATPQKPKAAAPRKATLQSAAPSELEARLKELEQQFRQLDAGPDSEERLVLWERLAETYAQLGQVGDAVLCWTCALWERDGMPAECVAGWYAAETADASADRTAANGRIIEEVLTAPQQKLSPTQLGRLAAHLVHVAYGERDAEGSSIQNHLPAVQAVLEARESFLPVRSAWLAWLAFARLAGGDVLALARARDRLLERLYVQGLSAELDLPAFLRMAGQRTGERFRAARDQLADLREKIRAWVERESRTKPTLKDAHTAAYADLIVAYGFGRLGLTDEARALDAKARGELHQDGAEDPVHQWVREAFGHRISQALEGKSRIDRLPDELLNFFDPSDRLPAKEAKARRDAGYYLNKLRRQSRILQPHEQVNAYARYHRKDTPGSERTLSAALEELVDLEDRDALAGRLAALLEEFGPAAPLEFDPLGGQVLLTSALRFGPRLGEAHTRSLLDQVPATLEELNEPNRRAVLLEAALSVAAHFGLAAPVRTFTERLRELFDTSASPETAETFGNLLRRCVRGLRKLGMRQEVSELLEETAQLVKDGKFERSDEAASRKKPAKAAAAPDRGGEAEDRRLTGRKRSLTLMLQVAAGWFYFGQTEQAVGILNEVRAFLFEQQTLKPLERLSLVRSYCSTLEQAPAEVALPRFAELFEPGKLDHVAQPKASGNMIRGALDACERYYSPALLDVVEAVILAIVSDEFTLDREGRRLLDEQEFFVRRRIHKDVETARHAAGL